MKIIFHDIEPEGKAVGRAESGKVAFAYGILPGETARCRIMSEKKGLLFVEAEEILESSSHRIAPEEDHYLACSPWQIIEYRHQLELKAQIIRQAFLRMGKTEITLPTVLPSHETFGTRTKMEYRITRDGGGAQLAFHQRGSYKEKIALPHGCKLASPLMNESAIALLDENVERVVVRESKTTGAIAAIAYDSTGRRCGGNEEADHLEEKIAGRAIHYPLTCFFQNHIPLFNESVFEIARAAADSKKVVELYCGVGAIGLAVSATAGEVIGVESHPESVEAARRNAHLNGVTNFSAIHRMVEKMPSKILHGVETVIVDPPRAGLGLPVVADIVEAAPQRIAYLSCNPVTLARDFNWLSTDYAIEQITSYDFYPHTPHVETLLILSRM